MSSFDIESPSVGQNVGCSPTTAYIALQLGNIVFDNIHDDVTNV
jgi:hypothetical protein